MNNKKTITYLIIFVVFMIVIIAGATFAFFASTQDINANLPANITTAGKTYTFIASSEGEINFYLSAQDMLEDNVNENYIMTDNGLINVEVASANNEETTTCTYDIAWVWDSADKYVTSDVELPYEKDGKTYPYELSVSVDGGEENDLSTFTLDSNNSFIIATGLQSMATSTTPVINSHKIEVKAYNIPIDQQNLFNKSFQAHMEVRNVSCDVVNVDGDIAVLSSGTFYNSLNVATTAIASNFTDSDNTEYSGAVVNENGLRFEGKNPNNYVQFNDELWRIIGVFDENTHGRSGEQLVKLIRAEALPQYYQWDANDKNNWSTATLKETLNNNYYNNTDINACSNYNSKDCISTTVSGIGIKNKIARDMIQPVTWYLGGNNNANQTTSTSYIMERDESKVYSGNLGKVNNLPIGLMYLSDYGYAVLSEDCSRDTLLSSYSQSNCASKNWIETTYSKIIWTLTHDNNTSYNTFIIFSDGYIMLSSAHSASNAVELVPVLYLKQNVTIIGGLGTKANPYTITM